MVLSPFHHNDSSSLTKQTAFALFAKYPEITFGAGDTPPDKISRSRAQYLEQLDSSPTSSFAEDEDRSRSSASTAHTTPLRPLYLLRRQGPDDTHTVAGYLRRVRHLDLPEECRLCFVSLAQSIGAISAGLVPSTNGRYRINNTYFVDQCSTLLREIQVLLDRTKEQVKLTASLKTFVIFQATPPDDMLWAVYRQRARLIIKLTALPSSIEHHHIHKLACLYNTIVYAPTQQLYDDDKIEAPTIRLLNKLYDLLFTWAAHYTQWCKEMRSIKERYMTPLIDRILASEVVRMDVKSIHRAKENAEIALEDPMRPSMLPVDERVLQELNLSARRKTNMVLKRKPNFKRDKTI